jgi:eukaryotic-like serine/threonine-protein kinase
MTDSNNAANLWQRAKTILADALALPPTDRAHFVDTQCKDDTALKNEVLSLLKHAENSTDFIESPPQAFLDASIANAFTQKYIGTRVGAYILGEEIGRGGMGLVYAASRADGAYESQVAVKLLKQNVSTDKDARRMTRERQALAQLNHPNIARLIDGGAMDDGMPYLVMEYIDGTQIDNYCQRKKLTLRERVSLIRQVAAAVQSAHQQLLIHRDIKPANILVNQQGQPKLLDFGIARLLDLNADIGATQDAMLPFTPRYASPEQVRGEPVSVATDIYGLGVLLYELLAGASPYLRFTSGEITTAAAAMDVVISDPPRKASDVAQAGGNTSDADALRGDLDIILSKACAKLPSERYATVAALDADLLRWCEGRPILAKPQSWAYSFKKFINRHRLATAATFVALLLIGAGMTGTVLQRNKAEQRYLEVRQIANSFIFEYYDAIEPLPGAKPILKRMVTNGLGYLDKLYADAKNDPTLAVELAVGYRKLALALFNGRNLPSLGDRAGADAAFMKARALMDQAIVQLPNDANANIQLARLDSDAGALLTQDGKFKEGMALYDAAIARFEAVLARDKSQHEAAFHLAQETIGATLFADKAGKSATDYIERGRIAIDRYAALKPNSFEVDNLRLLLLARQFMQLAGKKDYAAAIDIADQQVAGYKAYLKKNPNYINYLRSTQATLANKAALQSRLKQYAEALITQDQAIDAGVAILKTDPNNIDARNANAHIYSLRGLALRKLERNREALESYQLGASEYRVNDDKDLAPWLAQHRGETLWHVMTLSQTQRTNVADSAVNSAEELIALATKYPNVFAAAPASDWVKEARALVGKL